MKSPEEMMKSPEEILKTFLHRHRLAGKFPVGNSRSGLYSPLSILYLPLSIRLSGPTLIRQEEVYGARADASETSEADIWSGHLERTLS